MPNKSMIYIVFREEGEYDDYRETSLAAFTTEAKANAYAVLCKKWDAWFLKERDRLVSLFLEWGKTHPHPSSVFRGPDPRDLFQYGTYDYRKAMRKFKKAGKKDIKNREQYFIEEAKAYKEIYESQLTPESPPYYYLEDDV